MRGPRVWPSFLSPGPTQWQVEEPEATKPDLLNLEPTKAGVLASRPLLTQISTQAGLDGSFRN